LSFFKQGGDCSVNTEKFFKKNLCENIKI